MCIELFNIAIIDFGEINVIVAPGCLFYKLYLFQVGPHVSLEIFTFVTAEDDVIFGAPPEEDEFSAFGKSGGLFSTSKGLFDDDADDEVKPCSRVTSVRLHLTPRIGSMAPSDGVHTFKNSTATIKEKHKRRCYVRMAIWASYLVAKKVLSLRGPGSIHT